MPRRTLLLRLIDFPLVGSRSSRTAPATVDRIDWRAAWFNPGT